MICRSRRSPFTGANKGIGFEIARQLGGQEALTLIGARDEALGHQAALSFNTQGGQGSPLRIDVTDGMSISAAAMEIEQQYGRLDILVNNAGLSGGFRGALG